MPSSQWIEKAIICVLVGMLLLESYLPKIAQLEARSGNSLPRTGNALLDTVNQSPLALLAKSKQQWLSAFAANATIQDPTGSQTHSNLEGFSLFHEALIEPHTIGFDIKHDFVDLEANKLTRVCDIHISFYRNQLGLGQIQPAHVVYEVDPSLHKITSLRANWEVSHSVAMGNSALEKLCAIPIVAAGFLPVLTTFGPRFTLEYLASFLIGPLQSGGKQIARDLLTMANREAPLLELFADGAKVQIGSQFLPPAALAQRWQDTTAMRYLGSPITSGLRTTARFERATAAGTTKHGVVHYESRQPFGQPPKILSLYVFEEA